MNKKIVGLISAATVMALPLLAAASANYDAPFPTSRNASDVNGETIMEAVLTFIWPIFIGYAIIMFIIAGYKFIAGKADEGRNAIIYGAIGVIVGVLAWSLPAIVTTWI